MVSYIDIHLSEEDLYKHTEELDLNCDQCHRGFKNINALRMHKVKTHNQVSTESDFRLRYRRQNPQKEVNKRYFCPVDGCSHGKDYFMSLKLLKQHYMKVHVKKNLSCKKCGVAKFSLKRDLKYHQKRWCPQREFSEVQQAKNSIIEKGTSKKNQSTKTQETSNVHQHRKRPESRVNVKKILVITLPAGCRSAQFVPIFPRKSLRSVSCQTAPEVSLGTVPETDIYKEVHSRTYFSKDVATNVAAYDLCPPQQGFLPPVDSLSFQSEQTPRRNEYYHPNACSFATQTPMNSTPDTQLLNCSVSQSDCAVQSNLSEVPETRHVETDMDDFDFEEFLRNIETQTSESFGNDALTQTVNSFMDCGIMTDGPFQSWNDTMTE
ncbi:unnamed protein product [Enterobius vermicularis]|uniref:C2H2-type domain-containing protein n=1 Tax=Enterobius vermicularis TaxID=51028 RepID=A0A158Q9S4_ENTVE|nr:unnamed protein product [Enterobius vermicularis]